MLSREATTVCQVTMYVVLQGITAQAAAAQGIFFDG
jgi:hypothetical protein